MDDCDRADDRIESAISDGIAECRRQPSLIAVGFCHYCGEATKALFCDRECGADWEHEQARRKAIGK